MEVIIEASEGIQLVQEHEMIILKSVLETLSYENIDKDGEISVSVISNAEIRELNSEYRGIDKETDCLSFPQYEKEELEKEKFLMLGDVVISLEKAQEQAEEYGHELNRELAFLTAHSVLHLLGYDHEKSEADEGEMFKKQEEILKNMGLDRK